MPIVLNCQENLHKIPRYCRWLLWESVTKRKTLGLEDRLRISPVSLRDIVRDSVCPALYEERSQSLGGVLKAKTTSFLSWPLFLQGFLAFYIWTQTSFFGNMRLVWEIWPAKVFL